jgi:error-prone DNA polymerase
MGFWSPAILVNDAKRHNIPLYSIDVNKSDARCSLEGTGIRIGLNYVKGFGEIVCASVVLARGNRSFTSLFDFCVRTKLPKRLVEHLILAGGFDWLSLPRRQLLWELGGLPSRSDELPLLMSQESVSLPSLSRFEALQTEFLLTGVGLHEHPLERYRPVLKKRKMLTSTTVTKAPKGSTVLVAGLNVVHQSPPTAKGFHFITLEDEFGFLNIIVRPRIYTRYRQVIRSSPVLVVSGTVEREGAVTNVLAQLVWDFCF